MKNLFVFVVLMMSSVLVQAKSYLSCEEAGRRVLEIDAQLYEIAGEVRNYQTQINQILGIIEMNPEDRPYVRVRLENLQKNLILAEKETDALRAERELLYQSPLGVCGVDEFQP